MPSILLELSNYIFHTKTETTMPSLVELATQLVTAQASTVAMTTDYIVSSLNRIHTTLEELERSQEKLAEAPPEVKPTLKDAFKENEIVCLLCGKAYASLGTHLTVKHHLTSDEYREQFGIPPYQPLVAAAIYESRRKVFIERAQQQKKTAKPDAKLLAPPTPVPADVTGTVAKRGRPRKAAELVSSPKL
jgi:predicted transcriptional regulator